MTDSEGASDIPSLAEVLLPFSPDGFEVAIDEVDEPDLLSTTLAAYAVAAETALQQMGQAGRRTFCREVAADSDGEAAPWMVEASLRSSEGYRDALTGTDPSIMGSIPVWGLRVLSEKYLSAAQFVDLRATTVKRASAIRAAMRAQADSES
jgi:hypothetical protein